MSRSKTAKSKRDKGVSRPSAGPSSAPDAASLIDKAHTLLAQSNFDLAIKFLCRAVALEPSNLEARELLSIAELEGGDEEAGRGHLLHLFPPHTSTPPSTHSPYFYLAQSADDPREALGYYSTATAMLENSLGSPRARGKGRAVGGVEGNGEAEAAERKMAVTGLVAMIEIWMSDLCFEPEAEKNCDDLISRAILVSPDDPEVRLSLASIRMSQQRFDEGKAVILQMYRDIEEKEPFDTSLPSVPARIQLTRLLLEHSLHLPALNILSTVREEDELLVEGAYLEGWAWHLRAASLLGDPSSGSVDGDKEDGGEEDERPVTPDECFAESMRALLECAKLFSEQEYPDEGIGSHVEELLDGLRDRGVTPAIVPEEEGDEAEVEEVEVEGGWEDVEDGGGDVEMETA